MNANNVLKTLRTIASAAAAGRQFVNANMYSDRIDRATIAEQFCVIRDVARAAICALENAELEIGANAEREVRNASRAIAMAMANEQAGDSVEREVRRDEQMANTDADHRWP